LAEMSVQGVSTRKVKAIPEELGGHAFSASAVSAVVTRLDDELAQFAGRRLEEAYPYLILDARYERVREAGVIRSQPRQQAAAPSAERRRSADLRGAVLIAVGIDLDGRRSILAVELANRESATSWRDVRLGLKGRGLFGVEDVVSDDHPGLRAAIREVLPEAAWQRCGACPRAGLRPDPGVHFLRNACDHLPRTADDDCLQELRWRGARPRAGHRPDPGDRRQLAEARQDLAAWLAKWQVKYPKLCAPLAPAGARCCAGGSSACCGGWVEENIEETLTLYRLPESHHKHLKSTNMLERLNEASKRRTYVVRIFPNAESCLRLVRALAVEIHEDWLEAHRYLNMEDLKEHKKELLRLAA
jgi:putative transposase